MRSFKVLWTVLAIIGGWIGLMASLSPGEAKSNLSQWSELFGLPTLEHFLTPAVDDWVLVVALFSAALGVCGLFHEFARSSDLLLPRIFPVKTRARVFHRDLSEFRRDHGRGDLAARLIVTAPDFDAASGIFDDWRYDRHPRAKKAVVDAMVNRLLTEGQTEETEVFLNGAMTGSARMMDTALPEDPHGVNEPHRYGWMIASFEKGWKDG